MAISFRRKPAIKVPTAELKSKITELRDKLNRDINAGKKDDVLAEATDLQELIIQLRATKRVVKETSKLLWEIKDAVYDGNRRRAQEHFNKLNYILVIELHIPN